MFKFLGVIVLASGILCAEQSERNNNDSEQDQAGDQQPSKRGVVEDGYAAQVVKSVESSPLSGYRGVAFAAQPVLKAGPASYALSSGAGNAYAGDFGGFQGFQGFNGLASYGAPPQFFKSAYADAPAAAYGSPVLKASPAGYAGVNAYAAGPVKSVGPAAPVGLRVKSTVSSYPPQQLNYASYGAPAAYQGPVGYAPTGPAYQISAQQYAAAQGLSQVGPSYASVGPSYASVGPSDASVGPSYAPAGGQGIYAGSPFGYAGGYRGVLQAQRGYQHYPQLDVISAAPAYKSVEKVHGAPGGKAVLTEAPMAVQKTPTLLKAGPAYAPTRYAYLQGYGGGQNLGYLGSGFGQAPIQFASQYPQAFYEVGLRSSAPGSAYGGPALLSGPGPLPAQSYGGGLGGLSGLGGSAGYPQIAEERGLENYGAPAQGNFGDFTPSPYQGGGGEAIGKGASYAAPQGYYPQQGYLKH